MVSTDDEFHITYPEGLSPEQVKETIAQGKDTLSYENGLRKMDDIRLSKLMNETSKQEFEAMEVWLGNNLRHIKLSITYLGIFATDDLSKAMIKSLFERLAKLEKSFEKHKKPRPSQYTNLPFDANIAFHVHENMIPLVVQVSSLKNQVDGFSKKFFKI